MTKIIQMTQSQETKQDFISLYADMNDFDSILDTLGKYSNVKDIIFTRPVLHCLSLVNTTSVLQTMYPKSGPFNAFKFCSLKALNCIIIGGLPNDKTAATLSVWSGSSYCYNTAGFYSSLHNYITQNSTGGSFKTNTLDPSLDRLQKNGVLLIPEVLSTYVGGNSIMQMAWEPLIWNFLAAYTTVEAEVPILFTTESAADKFRSALDGAKYVFTSYIEDKEERENSKTLHQVERLVKDAGARYFNFFTLAQR